MNKQTKIGLVGGIVLVMMLLIWLFSYGSNDNKKKSNQVFTSTNWKKKYQVYDKNPLGLYLFTALSRVHIDSNHTVMVATSDTILDSLIRANDDPKTFLFVGNHLGLHSVEFKMILDEVEKGSDIFLAYNKITENIADALFEDSDNLFDYAPSINIYTEKKKYSMLNIFQTDTIADNWNAFGKIELKNAVNYKVLSSFMEMSNFIKYKHGKGRVLLNTTPKAFYNYQLKRKTGFKYSEFVLNQLSPNQDIIILELGRLSDNYGDEDVDEETGDKLKKDDSYLTLLFKNPTLLKAMLLAIIGMLLFVIFRSKRTQPVVPYITKKKDMTLAFADTITSIYFAKRNPYGLLQVQKRNFYSMVQKHFYIDLSRDDKKNAIESLAEKSNYKKKELIQLINLFETKEAFSVDDQYVSKTLIMQQEFYRSVGIINDKTMERTSQREAIYRRSLFLPGILILGGIFVFFFGIHELVNAKGYGILLWPMGFSLIFIGSLRIIRPYLKIEGNIWKYYSAWSLKKTFNQDEITQIEILTKGTIVHFGENKKLIINYWDLSRFDQKQFKRFISKLHTQQL